MKVSLFLNLSELFTIKNFPDNFCSNNHKIRFYEIKDQNIFIQIKPALKNY